MASIRLRKEANLPRVYKFHKEILFKDWKAYINHAEKAAAKALKLAKKLLNLC